MRGAAFFVASLALVVGCGPARTRAGPEDNPVARKDPPTARAEPSVAGGLWPNAAVPNLMRVLLSNPGRVPPMKQAPPVGVRLTFVVRADLSLGTIRATPLQSPNLNTRLAKGRQRIAPPHSWLVVFDRTTGLPLYWAAVENPFQYTAERAGAGGEVVSGAFRRRDGLVSAVLPFTGRACVAWLAADGTASLMQPDATFCFGDDPVDVTPAAFHGGGGP